MKRTTSFQWGPLFCVTRTGKCGAAWITLFPVFHFLAQHFSASTSSSTSIALHWWSYWSSRRTPNSKLAGARARSPRHCSLDYTCRLKRNRRANDHTGHYPKDRNTTLNTIQEPWNPKTRQDTIQRPYHHVRDRATTWETSIQRLQQRPCKVQSHKAM